MANAMRCHGHGVSQLYHSVLVSTRYSYPRHYTPLLVSRVFGARSGSPLNYSQMAYKNMDTFVCVLILYYYSKHHVIELSVVIITMQVSLCHSIE